MTELNADLMEILDAVPELAGEPRTVAALPGGLTNANYRVSTPAGEFVVRSWSDDTGLLAIDRDNEYENSVRAAAVGVGAEVIAYLPERNTMVFEFIHGRHHERGGSAQRATHRTHRAGVSDAPHRRALPGRLQHVRHPGSVSADRGGAGVPAAGSLPRVRAEAGGAEGGVGGARRGHRSVQQRPAGRELHAQPATTFA